MSERLNDRYALEQLLGRGGMGEVFAGRMLGEEGFSRRVAIKRMRPELISREHRGQFIHEALLSARLAHANIVSVLDLGTDENGQLFLVMELVEGPELCGLLRTGLLPLPVAIFIAKEILRGLGHAHELPAQDDGVRGLVHRDVSPQNVLITWDGTVKVSDFGIAKAREAAQVSMSFRVRGKVPYMSPEQVNDASIDGRSDLFAVGAVLWEMLTGIRLFPHSDATTLKSLLLEPIPSPCSRRPDLPHDVESVTMGLLEKERDRRYQDAHAAIAALDACTAATGDGRAQLSALLLARFPTRTYHRADETSVEAPPSVSLRQSSEPLRVSRPRRMGRNLAMLCAGTVLAAGAVGLAVHLTIDDARALREVPPPPSSTFPALPLSKRSSPPPDPQPTPPVGLPAPAAAVQMRSDTLPQASPRRPKSVSTPMKHAPPVDTNASPTRERIHVIKLGTQPGA